MSGLQRVALCEGWHLKIGTLTFALPLINDLQLKIDIQANFYKAYVVYNFQSICDFLNELGQHIAVEV